MEEAICVSDTTERRRWHGEDSATPADRLIDWLTRLFIIEPIAASAGVLLIVGALSNSGAAGFVGFVIALLFASQLRKRHERDL